MLLMLRTFAQAVPKLRALVRFRMAGKILKKNDSSNMTGLGCFAFHAWHCHKGTILSLGVFAYEKSITQGKIDQTEWFDAAANGRDARRHQARRMGRDGDAGMAPQRMILRQGLRLEDVEGCTGQMP